MSSSNDPRTIVIGYNGFVSTFTTSPLNVRPRAGITRWIYSSLLRFDEKLALQGDLVQDYSVSEDGLSYMFRLRPQVYWHDGHPFSADDVIFTASLLQQHHRTFRNTLLIDGKPIEFTKVDDLTVQISLPKPHSFLPAYLTPVWGSLFLVVPKHILENGAEEDLERHPIGTGPFKFGQISDGGDLLLTANENYFKGRPKVDHILVRFFAQEEERVEAFRRGEIDILISPSRKFTDEEAQRCGGRLYTTTSNTIVQFAMNCRHPLFRSARVRQAIAHAVDKEQMVRDIEGEDAVISHSPVGPICWAFEPDVRKYQHDPEQARALLAEEGWLPDEDGILRKNSHAFRFSVIYPPSKSSLDLEGYAIRLKQYLRNIGILLDLQPADYWSGMKSAWRMQSFESFLFYDTFYIEPDLYWSWHSSMPNRPKGPADADGLPQYGYGVTGYVNPAVDNLIEAAREEMDQDRRRRLLSEAQKTMTEEVASLWLHNYPLKNVVNNRIKGLSEPSIADGTADLISLLYPERLSKT